MSAVEMTARIYAWEDEFALSKVTAFTEEQAAEGVRLACELYDVAPPARIIFPEHADASHYDSKLDKIQLVPTHRNHMCVLHEAAHCISHRLHGEKSVAKHGSKWLGIYVWLLEHYDVMPKVAIRASLRKHSLRYYRTPPDK